MCVKPTPFIKGILIPHGRVTTGAQRNQIGNDSRTTPAFGDVVSHMKIKRSNTILTPGRRTRRGKPGAIVCDPHLLTKSLWDLGFFHYLCTLVTQDAFE